MNTENIIDTINNLRKDAGAPRTCSAGSRATYGEKEILITFCRKENFESVEFYELATECKRGEMNEIKIFRGALASANFAAVELANIIAKTL